jgi:hypothetical protein
MLECFNSHNFPYNHSLGLKNNKPEKTLHYINMENREYRSKEHPHPLRIVARDNGWACNGMRLPGGCRKGCTGFSQTTGWTRYRCIIESCDFDFCEGCIRFHSA